MPEQERFQPTREQIIEAKFGKETLEQAASFSKSMFDTMKTALANIGNQEGSSQQQKEKVEQYFAMWRDFANGLFARTSSENATSPEIVETAIKGANALLAVEPLREYDESAQKMKEALEKRY